jgi:hypothetical protein
MHKALGSITSTTKKKRNKFLGKYNLPGLNHIENMNRSIVKILKQ